MSDESVQSSVIGAADRLAQWRQSCQDLVSVGGGTLWDRADASDDVDYENTVEGVNLAAVDSAIGIAAAGAVVANWFTEHADYFSDKGYTGLSGYCAARGARVHEYTAELYYDRYSQRMTPPWLFPANSRTIAEYVYSGGNVFSPTTGINSGTFGPTMVEGFVSAITSPAAVYSLAFDSQFGSPAQHEFLLTLTDAGVGSAYTVGEEAIVSDVAAGDQNIYVDSTGHFVASEVVLITDTGKAEARVITSISGNTYVRVQSPVVTSYAQGTAYLVPAFYNVASCAHASGATDEDAIVFRPKMDRTPGW